MQQRNPYTIIRVHRATVCRTRPHNRPAFTHQEVTLSATNLASGDSGEQVPTLVQANNLGRVEDEKDDIRAAVSTPWNHARRRIAKISEHTLEVALPSLKGAPATCISVVVAGDNRPPVDPAPQSVGNEALHSGVDVSINVEKLPCSLKRTYRAVRSDIPRNDHMVKWPVSKKRQDIVERLQFPKGVRLHSGSST